VEGEPAITGVPFSTYSDIARELERLTADPPDLLFMAAAVSDYVPVAQPGKIRSDADELVIHLKKTAKLLPTLRDRCGPNTYLIGFKLLSNVSHEELVETAKRQVKGGRLNLSVANDLKDFTDSKHPVTLVTLDGEATRIDDARERVAQRLVAFALNAAKS
jgi:phosphopantothenoylcysteine synthetase/decarboxylase